MRRGFGPLGHLTAPSPSQTPPLAQLATGHLAGMHLRERWSLSGDQGWWLESGHRVVGSLRLQHHRPHIPGRLECGRHSSVHHALDSGGWRRPSLARRPFRVANRSRDSGPLTGREGKAWGCTFLLVNSDSLGDLRSGASSLRPGSLPRHTATGLVREVPQVPHEPCEIKSA